MKQAIKRTAAVGLAGVLTMTSLTGCGSFKNDDIVATVGKDEITAGMANFYARMQQAQYESYYASMMGTTGEAMWTQEVDEEGTTYEASVKESLLTTLENLYLMKQHASEYEVVVTDDELKKIKEAASEFDDANALEDKEAVSGYKKYVEEFLRLATISEKMQEPMKAGVDEEVSDEEAAQKSMKYVYFAYSKTDEEGNSTDMTDEEKAALKEEAQEFADNLKATDEKDIDAAASEGGYEVLTATFDAESVSPDANLIEAVDALKTEGDVTDVIESDYGLYVGKLVSLLDREATDEKKTEIVNERKQEQYDSLLEKWREDTEIKEYEKVWNKINFQKQGVTIKESEDQYEDLTSEE